MKLLLQGSRIVGLAAFVIGLAITTNATLTIAQERRSSSKRMLWALQERQISAAVALATEEEQLAAPEKQSQELRIWFDDHRASIDRENRAVNLASYGAVIALLGLLILMADIFTHVRTRKAKIRTAHPLAGFTDGEQQVLAVLILAVALAGGAFSMYVTAENQAEEAIGRVKNAALMEGVAAPLTTAIAYLDRGTTYLQAGAIAAPLSGICLLVLWILVARGPKPQKSTYRTFGVSNV